MFFGSSEFIPIFETPATPAPASSPSPRSPLQRRRVTGHRRRPKWPASRCEQTVVSIFSTYCILHVYTSHLGKKWSPSESAESKLPPPLIRGFGFTEIISRHREFFRHLMSKSKLVVRIFFISLNCSQICANTGTRLVSQYFLL